MAERGDTICLLGRNVSDLERSAADLSVRGAAGTVPCTACDLERPETFSPAIDAPIAMAYVACDAAEAGAELLVEAGDELHSAEVVELPFYRRRAQGTS